MFQVPLKKQVMAKERHNHLGTSEEVRERWHFYVDNWINLNDDRIVHPNTLDDHNHQIIFRSYLKSLRSFSNVMTQFEPD